MSSHKRHGKRGRRGQWLRNAYYAFMAPYWRWRYGSPAIVGLRPRANGDFDEVIVETKDRRCMVHVETMDENTLWIGFYHDGTKCTHLSISAGTPLRYRVYGDPPNWETRNS